MEVIEKKLFNMSQEMIKPQTVARSWINSQRHNMSLKIQFLNSHLDFFPDNIHVVSDEKVLEFLSRYLNHEKVVQDAMELKNVC